MRKILFLILSVSICGILHAQEANQYLFNRTPEMLKVESPHTASFNKYIDNPISLYNGTPDVSIPLYTLKDGSKQPTEYPYDANGKLTKDLNKKITDIQYNYLNLPCRITFENGDSISYLYASDGIKLRAKHTINNCSTITDYCGNVIYENGIAKSLLTSAGYVSLADGKHHYYIKDHQGNNRVVADENGNVEERNDYYPFGGLMASSTSSVQPYKIG